MALVGFSTEVTLVQPAGAVIVGSPVPAPLAETVATSRWPAGTAVAQVAATDVVVPVALLFWTSAAEARAAPADSTSAAPMSSGSPSRSHAVRARPSRRDESLLSFVRTPVVLRGSIGPSARRLDLTGGLPKPLQERRASGSISSSAPRSASTAASTSSGEVVRQSEKRSTAVRSSTPMALRTALGPRVREAQADPAEA